MVDRIRWDTVSYLPFYYVFFQFLLLTIFNLQANILTTKDILSNLAASALSVWAPLGGKSFSKSISFLFGSTKIVHSFRQTERKEVQIEYVSLNCSKYYTE